MKKLVLTAMFIGLVGCGHKEDSNSDSASVNPLAGTKWKSVCLDDSTSFEFDYEGSNNVMKRFVYDDSSCGTPNTVSLTKRAYSVSGQNVDYVVQSVTVKLLTEAQVEGCNESKCFGLDGWVLNAEKDVTGLSQDDNTAYKAGDKTFQIFKIDGGDLFFGDTANSDEDGSSAAKRPKDFDMNYPFTKI